MSKKLITVVGTLLLGTLVTAHAVAADKVNFALNWIPYGLHFGPYMAEEQGFYRENGIDIEITRGFSSADTTKRVGTGTNNFGMADSVSLIQGVTKGLPVKAVAMVLDKSSDVIYYIKGRGIQSIKDLEGRTLGAAAGESGLNLLPALGKAAGIDHNKIKVVTMPPPSKFPSLVSGQVDTTVNFTTEEPTLISTSEKAGLEIGRFLYSDYGVDRYSITLITSDDVIKKDPDLVRRVVEATMRGYAWARDNPEKAADLFVQRFPESSRNLVLAQFRIVLQHMITDLSRKHGLGFIDASKMARTIALVDSYTHFDRPLKPEDVYTMKFLPKISAVKK